MSNQTPITPEQARALSQQKVKQINDLMQLLHVRMECKEFVTPEGYIEKGVIFIDAENYNIIKEEVPAVAPEETPTPDADVTEATE
jgi:hypothetical protein